MPAVETKNTPGESQFVRGLGLLDSTMLVAGSMIGSGIFIVSSDIARQVGSAGWLLAVWLITGILTVSAALSYGELAAMIGDRYHSWDEGVGAQIEGGRQSFKALEQYVLQKGQIAPNQSGRQELFENVVNRYVF